MGIDPILDIGEVLKFISEHFRQEWTVIAGAPVTLMLIAMVLAILFYYVHKHRFSHIIDSNNSIILSKDATIETLKERSQLVSDRLQELAERAQTNAAGSPEQIVAAANTKIDELSDRIVALGAQVIALTEASRHITSDQRRRFGVALPKIVPLASFVSENPQYSGVRITYGSTLEAHNYAEELGDLFGGHGITVSRVEEHTHESLNIPGLQVLIIDPSNPSNNDQVTLKLLDAAEIQYDIKSSDTGFPAITVLRVGKIVLR